MLEYVKSVITILSQLVNTVFLFGDEDECVAGRAYRRTIDGNKIWKVISVSLDTIYFFRKGHCKKTYTEDISRAGKVLSRHRKYRN